MARWRRPITRRAKRRLLAGSVAGRKGRAAGTCCPPSPFGCSFSRPGWPGRRPQPPAAPMERPAGALEAFSIASRQSGGGKRRFDSRGRAEPTRRGSLSLAGRGDHRHRLEHAGLRRVRGTAARLERLHGPELRRAQGLGLAQRRPPRRPADDRACLEPGGRQPLAVHRRTSSPPPRRRLSAHARAGGADRRSRRQHPRVDRHPHRHRRPEAGRGRHAPGQGGRRGGQPRQERVPGEHEPRDSHADERHHRHDRAGARHRL